MNHVYPGLLDALGRAEVNLETDDLILLLVDDGYTYDPTDEFLTAVAGGARHGTATAIAGTRTMAGGLLSTDVETTTITSVPADVDDVEAILIYVDGATDADRRLLGYIDRQADTTLITFTPDNGDALVTFPLGQLLRI